MSSPCTYRQGSICLLWALLVVGATLTFLWSSSANDQTNATVGQLQGELERVKVIAAEAEAARIDGAIAAAAKADTALGQLQSQLAQAKREVVAAQAEAAVGRQAVHALQRDSAPPSASPDEGPPPAPTTEPPTTATQNWAWSAPLLQEQDRIDADDETARCARYNWRPCTAMPANCAFRPNQRMRRIYFGSLIADETKELMRIHAAEAYGVYHTVALVESDISQSGLPRKPHFSPWSIANGLFGDVTAIVYKFLGRDEMLQKKNMESVGGLQGLVRENGQRQHIIQMWIDNGMTPQDIGILSDVDEMFKRDFLRALQVCDVHQFRPGGDCDGPKIHASSLVFEMSPLCQKTKMWSHPAAILGECIHSIGDSTGRHEQRPRLFTGKESDLNRAMLDNLGPAHGEPGKRPLFTPWDIRMDFPAHIVRDSEGSWSGYHVHNFFADENTIRNKYATYGHPMPVIAWRNRTSLLGIHDDLDFAVGCALNDSLKALPEDTASLLPLYFRFHSEYVLTRHRMLQQLIRGVEPDK